MTAIGDVIMEFTLRNTRCISNEIVMADEILRLRARVAELERERAEEREALANIKRDTLWHRVAALGVPADELHAAIDNALGALLRQREGR